MVHTNGLPAGPSALINSLMADIRPKTRPRLSQGRAKRPRWRLAADIDDTLSGPKGYAWRWSGP